MSIFRHIKLFSMTGVSIIGGVAHNLGQILVAMVYLESGYVIFYFPALLVSGVITGTLIGLLGMLVVKRLKNAIKD